MVAGISERVTMLAESINYEDSWRIEGLCVSRARRPGKREGGRDACVPDHHASILFDFDVIDLFHDNTIYVFIGELELYWRGCHE